MNAPKSVKLQSVFAFTQMVFVLTIASTKTRIPSVKIFLHPSRKNTYTSSKSVDPDQLDTYPYVRYHSTRSEYPFPIFLLNSKLHPKQERVLPSFLNGNDPLEIFSLSKIPSSTLQPSVPPSLSSSKKVLAMSDFTNLAQDL